MSEERDHLNSFAASSRATLERELGQQKGSGNEPAYVPLSLQPWDSKHVPKTMDALGATLRVGCATRKMHIHPQSGLPPTSSPTKKTGHCQTFQPCPLFPKGHATLPSLQASVSIPLTLNCPFQFLLGLPTASSSDHFFCFWIHSLEECCIYLNFQGNTETLKVRQLTENWKRHETK